jgi:hypothetical protein
LFLSQFLDIKDNKQALYLLKEIENIEDRKTLREGSYAGNNEIHDNITSLFNKIFARKMFHTQLKSKAEQLLIKLDEAKLDDLSIRNMSLISDLKRLEKNTDEIILKLGKINEHSFISEKLLGEFRKVQSEIRTLNYGEKLNNLNKLLEDIELEFQKEKLEIDIDKSRDLTPSESPSQ